MIYFNPQGDAIVKFDIRPIVGKHSRRSVELPLSDYLALAKVADTLEELKILILNWKGPSSKAASGG